MSNLHLLMIEDSKEAAARVLTHLEGAGYQIDSQRVKTAEDLKHALDAQDWDLVISAYHLSDFNGMEAHRIVKARELDLPFIIVSGTIGEDAAVQAMLAGVSDFLMKDNLARLVPAIRRELRQANDRRAGREAETALQKSEQRYRELFENANDAIFTVDREGRYTSVNKKFEEVTGYGRDEILLTNFADLLTVDDVEKINSMIDRKLSGELETTRYELLITTKSSNQKNIEVSSRVIYQEGRAVGIQGIARDITERKRVEQELRESEENFRALVEATTQQVWTLDLSDTSTEFFRWWMKLTGQTLEECQDSGWLDAVHPEDRAATTEAWRRTFEENTLYDHVYRLRLASGEYRYYAVRGVPVFRENGAPRQWIGTFTDITDRKRTEAELQESEHRLQLAIAAARLGVWEWNMLTGSLFWSETNYAIFGRRDPITGPDDFLNAVHPEDRPMVWENTEKTLLENKVYEMDFRIVRPGGEVRWINSRAIPTYDEAGQPWRLLGLSLDFTDQKNAREELARSEESLRQAQKLESVGRLAGGIAHDFNNMLTAINGYTDLVLRRLDGDDPLRRYLEEIKKAGDRSKTLTHQLLAYSRRQILQPKILDINQVISETMVMLRRLIGENVRLTTALDPQIGRIEADPGQISQVIINLVVNARDAMPQGGTVLIETKNISIGDGYSKDIFEIVPGEYVYLAVTDTGHGIDGELIDSIFEPFYTTKEVGKGTGLGLATVYGIIKQSGGQIYVRKGAGGQGTTFEIYLPHVAATLPAEEQHAAAKPSGGGHETILIVEDEPIVRKLTREILESFGYQIIEAADGAEALKIYRQRLAEIDLLLTDVVLPIMSGYQLADELAKHYPQLKIIFTSGYANISRAGETDFEAGQNFIHKPFKPDALAALVREILDDRKAGE